MQATASLHGVLMEKVVEVANVSKSFKTYERASSGFLASFRRHYYTKKALISVSFSIGRGQIVALLGRNGAGKSTLIKILTGILYPDSGTVNVLGFNPWKERMKLAWNIGVVLGAHGQMYWNLPAYDTFEYMRKIYNVPEEEFKKRLAHFVDILDLKYIYKKPVRTMSLGEMMKCNFVASTLHMPQVVFLDEPTIGVDIMSKAALKNAMLEMRAKYGTTFILTTHIVEDISIADRVLMLHKGRLVFDGAKEKLEHMFGNKRVVEIKFTPDAKLNLDFGKVLYKGTGIARLEINASVLKSRRFISLLSSKSVIDYSVSAPGLSELLAKMYTKLEKVH